jgi:predicted N-acetyltransferase YhbS
MNFKIRVEERKDWATVEDLTRKAFWNDKELKEKGLGCNEHYLAHCLRESPDFIPELNFVLELEDKIVANIMYTHAWIEGPEGNKHKILTFGPVSVLPEYQKQGIGSAIIKHSLEAAKQLGYKAVIIYGHPEYYPRFGFKEAKEYGITTDLGANFPAFMALELVENALDGINGKLFISRTYNVDHEKAMEFDKKFQ